MGLQSGEEFDASTFQMGVSIVYYRILQGTQEMRAKSIFFAVQVFFFQAILRLEYSASNDFDFSQQLGHLLSERRRPVKHENRYSF